MRKVKIDEATAARRRLYFFCVDATDGLTPETGEAGGQPQISVDGGALTSTGIGVLSTHIGGGGYYAEVAQNQLDAVKRIDGYYKSANTAAAWALEALEVVDYDDADLVDEIATEIGGIVGVPTAYAPTSATRTIGSDQGGAYTDLAAHDETNFSTGENASTGLSVTVDRSTSTTTERPSVLRVSGYYNGSSGHSVSIQVYDYTLAAYVQRGVMLSRTTAFDYLLPLTSDNQNPSTGAMSVRFVHSTSTYNASHRLHLDYVSWEKVGATALNLETDIAAIKMRTDQLQFATGAVYAVDGSGAALATAADASTAATQATAAASSAATAATQATAAASGVAAVLAAAQAALAACQAILALLAARIAAAVQAVLGLSATLGGNLRIARGEDKAFTLTASGGDLTTSEIKLTVRQEIGSPVLILKRNVAAGGSDAQIDVTSATTATVYFDPADTDGLAVGTYTYDVWVTDAAGEETQVVEPKKLSITPRVRE